MRGSSLARDHSQVGGQDKAGGYQGGGRELSWLLPWQISRARIMLGALFAGLKTSVEAITFRAVHTRRARPQGREHERNQ